MKKLSLDDTWRECLRMWKWIAGQCRGKKKDSCIISLLKSEWLRMNEYTGDNYPSLGCFFCDYAYKHSSNELGSCLECPGSEIDEYFLCTNKKYNYETHPIKFYNKLVKLNKERKSVKS